MRSTKIVSTLGPASTSPEVLEKMILAGINVVRINFSHGSAKEHADRVRMVRDIALRLGCDVGVLADLQGPKIRVGKFAQGKVSLQAGAPFIFDIECDEGDQTRVGLDYKELIHDVRVGDVLLLDDGKLRMRVDRVTATTIICTCEVSGVLSNRKGINKLGGGLSAGCRQSGADDRQDRTGGSDRSVAEHTGRI
jgi:pyruvate kinase